MYQPIPVLSDQPPAFPVPTDLADRILTQAQHDFVLMEKHFALGVQSMANVAAMIPRMPPPPMNLFKDIGYVAAAEMVPQHIMPTLKVVSDSMSLYKEQQLQSLLKPIHTIMDDFRATTVASSSAVATVLAKTVCSNFAVDMEHIVQSFRNVLPSWEVHTPPALVSSALNVVNQFPPIISFFPDISWLTNFTDQINSFLAVLPDWLPLDLKRLKERIKQRLITAFWSVGLCFAPSLSEDLMYQIADLLETNGKRSSITLLIWNYYARHKHARLQQAVERWQDNPEYARRWQSILLPAFQAHTRGEYGLSISALAPLVEGIASHVVKKNMLLPVQKPRRGQLGLGSTESVILRTLRTAGDETNLESDTTDVVHWVRVKSVLGYVEDVFCKNLKFECDYDHIHFESRQLHRHGLLHGIQINGMTALNSLRLFLLLDTMHDLLQTYIARGGIM